MSGRDLESSLKLAAKQLEQDGLGSEAVVDGYRASVLLKQLGIRTPPPLRRSIEVEPFPPESPPEPPGKHAAPPDSEPAARPAIGRE